MKRGDNKAAGEGAMKWGGGEGRCRTQSGVEAADLPTPCSRLNADANRRTDRTIDKNFLRVVTRMVVTEEVSACRRYTPNMHKTCGKACDWCKRCGVFK